MELLFAIVFLAVVAFGIGLWQALPYILICCGILLLIGAILIPIIVHSVRSKRKNIENNVISAVIIDEKQIMQRQAVNTGYTISYGRRHNHYRHQDVVVEHRVTFSVVWKDGKRETITCKKDDAIYRILIAKSHT